MNKEEARQILAESICVNYEDCTDSAHLRHDLGADSLSMLSFGVEIADAIGVKDSDLDPSIYQMEIVGQLLDYVVTAANS